MSITLTTPKKIALNDVVVENNTQGADVSMSMDYLSNVATFIFSIGTVQGTPPNLNIGAYAAADTVTVTLDLTTGNWSSSNGKSGTLTGAAFNNFVSQMKATRNSAEVFASGPSAIMPGTQVPWN
jgi:hypothetical protein